jgi:hypothetical protein
MATTPAPGNQPSRPLAGPRAAWVTPGSLDARVLAPGDLAAAEIAALSWLDPDFEPEPEPGDHEQDEGCLASGDSPPLEEHRYGTIILDLCDGPVEGWDVTAGAQRNLMGGNGYPEGFCAEDPCEDGQDRFADLVEAGFTHRYPAPGATGFRAGGPVDQMLPGADLAWHLGAVRQLGLGELSDDELIGALAASRRVQSWQAALELAATAELDARRAAPNGREGEHVTDELAAALTLTSRAAQAQLELSRQLERLSHTAGLLAAGIIDRPRANVIASHLALLNDADAAVVDAKVAASAGEQTTGQLGARCHRAVVAHDPLAYMRRKKEAEREARVECWTEETGTASMAGRDLDRAATIAADKSLDEAARWLRQQGVEATFDELRAAVFLARLSGRPLETLLPVTSEPDALGGPDGTPGAPHAPVLGGPSWINLTVPLTTQLGHTDHPGEIAGTGAAGPADAGTCRQLTAALARNPATRWCLTITDATGRAIAHGCAKAGPGPPGSDLRAWLATITPTPIETGTCAHVHESVGYQPSRTLRHLVKIRSPRCGFPGCRRPARRCDDDHTIPYHLGGRTCECNLHPLCRHHHQTKQAQGWHLAQPEPGILVWTAPSGRRYTVTPDLYPV